jgi:putative oxidoreductase
MPSNNFSSLEDIGKLLLRIDIAGLMIFHGYAKFTMGTGMIQQTLLHNGVPGFVAYGVYVGEFFAPILIILGIFSRAFALIEAFDMIVAVLVAHTKDVFALKMGGAWGIELEAIYFFGSMTIFFIGAGRYKLLNNKSFWNR